MKIPSGLKYFGTGVAAGIGGSAGYSYQKERVKKRREIEKAIRAVIPPHYSDADKDAIVKNVMKSASEIRPSEAVELFKVAFGEEEFNALFEKAASEVAQELQKKN